MDIVLLILIAFSTIINIIMKIKSLNNFKNETKKLEITLNKIIENESLLMKEFQKIEVQLLSFSENKIKKYYNKKNNKNNLYEKNR